MSGRSLGHSGGSLDKLESLPGTRTALASPEILAQVKAVRACLCAQTADRVPADRMMYALRDATGTVHSRELIAASIMSKKIAGGSKSIVLDVKVGAGAFMETIDDARALAHVMVAIGAAYDRRVVAVLTDMNAPLGFNVGNDVEVREIVALLRNAAGVDDRLSKIVGRLSGLGFYLAGLAASADEGEAIADRVVASGEAFEMLCRIIEAQGGNPDILRHPEKQPPAVASLDVRANRDGYVRGIGADAIGLAAMRLGAGRATKDDVIDPTAGIVLRYTVGDKVRRDATLATLFASSDAITHHVAADVLKSIEIGDEPTEPIPLIYETVGL
jgi:pyrimidine-nucleoside phosphorylase